MSSTSESAIRPRRWRRDRREPEVRRAAKGRRLGERRMGDAHAHEHHPEANHRQGHHHGPEGHPHTGVDATLLTSQEAIRTLWRSLVILGATAVLQVVVVIASGSVALL